MTCSRTSLGCLLVSLALIFGCARTPIMETKISPKILDTRTGEPIAFDALIQGLESAQVVYIGEKHPFPEHHAAQLKVIRALARKDPELMVGMEMFSRPYQPVLDAWTAGDLSQTALLRQSHWYANWQFDFSLYQDILVYAQKQRLKLVALNLPFHIPAKIAVGGLESLLPAEKRHLPDSIDTSDPDHRAYVKAIYAHHQHLKGRDQFAFFYQAQCAWEDAMAEAVADHLGEKQMVVLAGSGHILRRFGIPKRAFARTRAPFKTILLVPPGARPDPELADYLWEIPVQNQPPSPHPHSMQK